MENIKILVVEDNKVNMKLFRSLLQLGKFIIFEAENAEQGIDLAEKIIPDLILMDIQLPGMDGLTATGLIKQKSSLSHIPVIALTSRAMQGDEKMALDAGCNGYISKPIDTRQFLNTLAKYLPMNQNNNANQNNHEDKAIQADAASIDKAKILIVDDEPMNVKLMRLILLSAEKYEVLEACDGNSAIKKVNEAKIDLILLDVMMPDLNGYEVIKILKNNPQTKSIPIILVTALSGQNDRMQGFNVGADEFISKPVNKIELLARIQSLLQLRQYQEQLNLHVRFEKNEIYSAREDNKRQRVLLVEDNEKDIKLFQNLVKNEPFELVLTRSGEEAIEIVSSEKIDLVLQDILLPGINGFDVCHHIKHKKETADIQIVMITCLSDLENRLKSISYGVDDFLVKPIDSRELKARINVLLKKKACLDQIHSHFNEALGMAITDGPTGLYNHIYFKRYLETEIERSLNKNYPIALVMMDLDNFKKYNDTLGHFVGDKILQEFAFIIKNNVREIDLPARYGGEEFAIVFPYLEKESILHITERIQNALRDHVFPVECNSPLGNITTSIGVAFCPSDAITASDLIDKADFMLYRAKKAGKNRTCITN